MICPKFSTRALALKLRPIPERANALTAPALFALGGLALSDLSHYSTIFNFSTDLATLYSWWMTSKACGFPNGLSLSLSFQFLPRVPFAPLLEAGEVHLVAQFPKDVASTQSNKAAHLEVSDISRHLLEFVTHRTRIYQYQCARRVLQHAGVPTDQCRRPQAECGSNSDGF